MIESIGLLKRIEELEAKVDEIEKLEARIDEMWERIKQFEAVMSTAFRLHAEGFRLGKEHQ